MEVKSYNLAPAIELVLHDAPVSRLAGSRLERHFNDLYHLFLNRYARLTQEAALSSAEAEELSVLLKEILDLKQTLEAEN